MQPASGGSSAPVLSGDRVLLRPVSQADAAARLSLGQDPALAELYGIDPATLGAYGERQAKAWAERASRSPHSWAIEHGGALIGEVRLDAVNLHDRRASLAIGLFEQQRLGQGLGSEAMRLVLTHAFDGLGLHRVGVRVLASNTRAIRAYEKLGFQYEGRERETAFVRGQWLDDMMLGLLAREFRRT